MCLKIFIVNDLFCIKVVECVCKKLIKSRNCKDFIFVCKIYFLYIVVMIDS